MVLPFSDEVTGKFALKQLIKLVRQVILIADWNLIFKWFNLLDEVMGQCFNCLLNTLTKDVSSFEPPVLHIESLGIQFLNCRIQNN